MKREKTGWQSDYVDPRVEAKERNMSAAKAIAHIKEARFNLSVKRILAEEQERLCRHERVALERDDELMKREIEILQSTLDEESTIIKGLQ